MNTEPMKVRPVEEFEKSKIDQQKNNSKEAAVKPLLKPDTLEKFMRLGITDPILRIIAEKKFEAPTEIQKKSIPIVVSHGDIIAMAATGSGKTLAFGAGIIQNSEMGKGLQALVLSPTRELAEQVARALKEFSKHHPLRIVTVYGGVSINPQIHAIRTADVVVGTPGRLLDHMNRRTITLKNINILVLDEADRMLDMGFINDVEKIINACPVKRQTLLFSATISGGVAKLARKYMYNPTEVQAESFVDPKKLEQVYYDTHNNLKFSLLVHLLKNEKSKLVMVFCNTRRYVDFVANNLKLNGINAIPIHGGFAQNRRSKTLDRFQAQSATVLVCTDVAARGLDIPHVTHIYNYDIPSESNQYIHRIGRTARAGKEGKVINILSGRDHESFSKVMRDNGIVIKRMEMPKIDIIKVDRTEKSRPQRGGRPQRGNRPQRGGRPPRRTSSHEPSQQRHQAKPQRKDGVQQGHGRTPEQARSDR